MQLPVVMFVQMVMLFTGGGGDGVVTSSNAASRGSPATGAAVVATVKHSPC